MWLSGRGRALLVDRTKVVDVATELGIAIAAPALREARALHKIWLDANQDSSVEMSKRRHKQTLAELLGFFYCSTEMLLKTECPAITDPFLWKVAQSTVRRALYDMMSMRLPLVVADMPNARIRRYESRITSARVHCCVVGSRAAPESLRWRAANEIAYWLNSPTRLSDDLEQIVSARMEWEARKLLGTVWHS